MERERAVFTWAGWGAASGALAALAIPLPYPWSIPFVVPWAWFLAGGAAALLLVPHLLADGREWTRVAGEALPGAAALFTVAEMTGGFGKGSLVHAAANVAILAGVLGLVLHRVLSQPVRERQRMLVWGLAPAPLALVWPPGVVLWLFGLQLAAFLALVGFRRTPYAWARASATGAAVLLSGLFLIWLATGDGRAAIVLDSSRFVALMLPLLGASALSAAAALLWWPERRQAWRATRRGS